MRGRDKCSVSGRPTTSIHTHTLETAETRRCDGRLGDDLPFEVSVVSLTRFWSMTSLNAGQPQPESNFVSDVNSVSSHTTHVYTPASVVLLYLPVNALRGRTQKRLVGTSHASYLRRAARVYLSVPFSWVTWYCMGDSRFFRSALRSAGCSSPPAWLIVPPGGWGLQTTTTGLRHNNVSRRNIHARRNTRTYTRARTARYTDGGI